jgi:hypothetical protein
MNIKHTSLLALHLRSSESEVNNAMHEAGAGDWEYAKDKEFEQFVLKDIKTIHQFRAFVKMLNADRWAMDGLQPNKFFTCQKTWQLKGKRMRDFSEGWTPKMALAMARRTCCGCHETGSFALSNRYHEKVK